MRISLIIFRDLLFMQTNQLNSSTGRSLPRILFVLMTKIRKDDPVNLLFRAQFGSWDKKDLAQVHANADPSGEGEFCGSYYRLSECDRFLGGVFLNIRKTVFKMVKMEDISEPSHGTSKSFFARLLKMTKKFFGDTLVSSGLWELLFFVRLSKPLQKFVSDFKPDIIYCQGYSLGFTVLPLLISKKLNIPICFQTTDDWPAFTYKNSLAGWILRREVQKLVSRSSLCFAFGEKMKNEYQRRYGVSFHVTYHLDDVNRFRVFAENLDSDNKRIIFTGSLGLNRHECIADLYKAILSLRKNGVPVVLDVYCTGLPKEIPEEIRTSTVVRFFPLPSHEDLGRVLKSADILFLPESFNVDQAKLSLSISTKCHLYMMAERPVLLYGPDYAGSMEYASSNGWGMVVSQRDLVVLSAAVMRLLEEVPLKQHLAQRSAECLRMNHDIKVFQDVFVARIVRSMEQPASIDA